MCYDSALTRERVEVIEQIAHADGMHSLLLRAPKVARSIRGGQFVHLNINEGDMVLRRPLSVFAAREEIIHIVYQVVGKGTDVLSKKVAGDNTMDIIGPLGHGWPVDKAGAHALVVAGGLGAAPLGMLVSELAEQGVATTMIQGAQTASRLMQAAFFKDRVRKYFEATDDGTAGHHGFVTGPLEELLAQHSFDAVFVCGPEPMQLAVTQLTHAAGIPTYVSLERLMACGVGACLSCVVPTVAGQKRACIDGPVFLAEEVCWDDARQSRIH